MNARKKSIAAAVAAVLIVVISVLSVRQLSRRLSDEQIRERVVATIQSEAKASFLVTGSLDLTATTAIRSTKVLLPGLLGLSLGTSRAIVQVPGRAHYGFDVRELDAKRITLRGDTVEVAVPQPRLLSVDANLQELRIWTQKGWLRTPASVDKVERTAIARLDDALRNQATSHIATSTQPHINSAEALRRMLTPVLVAAGIAQPVFRFSIGEKITLVDEFGRGSGSRK